MAGKMNEQSLNLKWKVLLIGGHSGAGKTLVAQRLARYYQVGLSEVDDFRLMLEQITTPEQLLGLHLPLVALTDLRLGASELCQQLITVATTMSKALEIVIANHVSTNTPLILEGDGLLPALAAQNIFAGLAVSKQVQAVFIIEADETQLQANMKRRGRGFVQLEAFQQQQQVQASWLYGQWLKKEAALHNIAVIAARPWNTLFERVLSKILV